MGLRLVAGLTLYFARHGETVANVERRFQGWSRDTALTARGIAQASTVANLLERAEPLPKRLAYVSSPLPRARKTMEIILADLHISQADYTVDERIAEINLGAWDGLTDAEARALDPQAFDEREHDKWNVRVPGGGENYADVARRAESWVHDLKADSFAVSHGAFTRVLRGLFLDLTWKQMSDLDEPQGCLFRARDNVVERF